MSMKTYEFWNGPNGTAIEICWRPTIDEVMWALTQPPAAVSYPSINTVMVMEDSNIGGCRIEGQFGAAGSYTVPVQVQVEVVDVVVVLVGLATGGKVDVLDVVGGIAIGQLVVVVLVGTAVEEVVVLGIGIGIGVVLDVVVLEVVVGA